MVSSSKYPSMELVITTEILMMLGIIHFWQRSSSLRHLFFFKVGYNLYYNVMISQISMNAPHFKDLMNLVRTGIL